MEAPERIDCRGVPRVAEGARFVPAEDLGATPNVVVDGARLPSTVLSLSHWPDSGTPAALRADTSALIVERYLACDADGPEVAAVTNNHYDEDGLLGIWLLLERPAEGSAERALAIAAAEAGDFGTLDRPLGAAGRDRGDGDGRAPHDALPRGGAHPRRRRRSRPRRAALPGTASAHRPAAR